MSMTEEEMKEFLKEKRLARFVTLKKDGSPHITPVWFHYEPPYFYVTARNYRSKVLHIRRDNRVALSIDREERPYKGVIVEGVAHLTTDRVAELTRLTARKYVLPPEDADKQADEMLTLQRITIRIEPKKLITWDNAKSGKS